MYFPIIRPLSRHTLQSNFPVSVAVHDFDRPEWEVPPNHGDLQHHPVSRDTESLVLEPARSVVVAVVPNWLARLQVDSARLVIVIVFEPEMQMFVIISNTRVAKNQPVQIDPRERVGEAEQME